MTFNEVESIKEIKYSLQVLTPLKINIGKEIFK